MALNLFEDESLILSNDRRGERNVEVYVPSFFTNQPQPTRNGRDTVQGTQSQYANFPIFYDAYSAPKN